MQPYSRQLYLRWIGANAASEAVGLGGSFIVGALLFPLLEGSRGVWPTLLGAASAVVLGTFLEGVLVGLAQGAVLRTALPGVGLRRWTLATSAGAASAWVLGMVPSTVISLLTEVDTSNASPPPDVPLAPQLALAAGMGLVLGPILALPQALVLRRHVDRAWRWVLANALAWAAALPLTFVGPQFLDGGLDAIAVIAIVTSVIAAGAVAGAIHGRFLVRMLGDVSKDSRAAPR